MEKDFRLTSRKFWQIVRRLRKGKQGLAQAVLSRGGKRLTQTEDIVGRWKEHFEELLTPTSTSLEEEAESEDSGEASPISLAEVAEVVKKADTPRQCCVDVRDSTYGMADRGGGPHFQKRGPDGVLQLSGYHTAQHPRES